MIGTVVALIICRRGAAPNRRDRHNGPLNRETSFLFRLAPAERAAHLFRVAFAAGRLTRPCTQPDGPTRLVGQRNVLGLVELGTFAGFGLLI